MNKVLNGYEELFDADLKDINYQNKYTGCFASDIIENIISKFKYPIIIGSLPILVKCAAGYFYYDYNLKKDIIDLLKNVNFSETNEEINKFIKQFNKIDLEGKVFNLYGIEVPIIIADVKNDDILIVYDAFDDNAFYYKMV